MPEWEKRVYTRYIDRDGRRKDQYYIMGMIEKLSYRLLKKNEYIGDFNEEYQILEKPIGIRKKMMGAAYMLTKLYHPHFRSEIFNSHDIKAYDFENIKRKIDQADVVSFDIFDTLLLRPVYQPTDMFYFLENDNHVIDFRKKRIRAEEWAREHTYKDNREIDLFDIYDCLNAWCGLDKKTAVTLEIEMEKRLSFVHPFVWRLYQYVLESHKVAVATSDMYISKEYMRDILSQKGYTGLDDIYISCDYQESKYQGGLYEVIKKNFKGKKILHIGDNRYSDIIKAKQHGISTVWIQNVNRVGERYRRFQHQSFIGSVYCGLVDAYIYNGTEENVIKCRDPYYLYGFLCGGPLTYGFCQWLDELTCKKKTDKIIFLARDGYIFSEIYKKYFQHTESEYAYASRQALLPVLCNVDYDMYLQEAFYKRIVSMGMKPIEAFKDVGVYSYLDEKRQMEWEHHFSSEHVTWDVFKEWMLDHKAFFQEAYQEQLQAITEYFKQMIGDKKNIIIFDLGWRGTSILYLKKYLETQIEGLTITGAMMGAQEMPMTELHVLHQDIEAYMFSEANPSMFSRINGQKLMYIRERLALEFMFTSPEASLLSYCIKGKEYIQMYVDRGVTDGINSIGLNRAACLPVWQVLHDPKVLKLFQKYDERRSTLHGFLNKKV